ncbi:Rv0909 family putative TA system antitoxin [uncultured Amnibacterium sp.]|uniref:Rv0909 family putative TA system antitoxin n=1 Tax=uncultured Amnibacterium sp. TaxID=1631851 RepID=UPI0035CAA1BF
MAGLGDVAGNFLNSDKGEQISDSALDKAAGAASAKAGDSHEEQIDKIRDAADGKLGDE